MNIVCQICSQEFVITKSLTNQTMFCPHCGAEHCEVGQVNWQKTPNIGASYQDPPKKLVGSESPIFAVLRHRANYEEPPQELLGGVSQDQKTTTDSEKGNAWTVGLGVLGLFCANFFKALLGIQLGALPTIGVMLFFGAIGWAIDDEKAKKRKLQKPKSREARWWNKVIANVRDNLKPSCDMNYRIFIPSILLSLLLGALLYSWVGERHRFQVLGNGTMVKTDRWTGQAWLMHSHIGRWEPVR